MTDAQDSRQTLAQWFPVAMRYGGLLGEAFAVVFWALTNRLEPALLTSFGVMMGIGSGLEALRDLTLEKREHENERERDAQETLSKSPTPKRKNGVR